MHILLTDLLTCPRCGPGHGLIMRADRIEDRRVESGQLGCSNCRESYPIDGWVADLRHSAVAALEFADDSSEDADERALRTAALIGAQPPNSSILILQESGVLAAAISSHFRESHVIAGSARAVEGGEEGGILSRVVHGTGLPYRSGSFRGVALLGEPSTRLLLEAARVAAKGGRVIADRSTSDTAEILRTVGLEVLLEQDAIVVAAATRAR